MSSLSRRSFLKGSTFFLGVAALGSAAAHPLFNPAAAQSGALGRPLRMLAIGDSVMWGQGLEEKHKFTYLVRNWLCERRGGGSCRGVDDVQLHVEAHSGAKIARPKKKDEEKTEERFTREFAPVRFSGEVNNGYPTNWGQLELALRYYKENSVPPSEVDLILVNGGINDLNATNILINRILGDDIKKNAEKFCRDEMIRFLYEAAGAFPNARIIVTGYFPLVSTETCTKEISDTLKDLLRSVGHRDKDDKGILKGLLKGLRKENADAADCTKKASPGKTLTYIAERSKYWVTVSNSALQCAVNAFNNGHRAEQDINCVTEPVAPEATARAIFVGVPFEPKNAYAAPESWLWQLTAKDKWQFATQDNRPPLVIHCVDENILGKLVAQDEIQGTRPCMCDHAGKRNDLTCVRAGTFHPNIKGANAYFEAIKEKLEKVVVAAGWTPVA